MPLRVCHSVTAVASLIGGALLLASCTSPNSVYHQPVRESDRASLAALTPDARATVDRVTAGGNIDQIDKETEKGRDVYDVEATVQGKHVEYTIAIDGVILGTETSIDFAELPPPVRSAAEKYFAGVNGLRPSKAVEDGQVSYEIEGGKNGKPVTATFDPEGQLIGEEK